MSALIDPPIHPQDLAQWVQAAYGQGPVAPATRVEARVMGVPACGPSLLELECGVYLQGRRSGLLALRCARSFGADLAQAAAGHLVARLQARQALFLFSGRLARILLEAGLFGRPPEASAKAPQSLASRDWPEGAPQLESLLLVGEQPLELRLWMEAPHA